MGKHARIGLLLGASACLLAVMVDWVVEELYEHDKAQPAAPAPGPVTGETEQPPVQAPDAGGPTEQAGLPGTDTPVRSDKKASLSQTGPWCLSI
jgi:hypothetical protein